MILTILLTIKLIAHPFHVSVTDIEYKEEKKAIQISSRIFLDDLELALQSFSGDQKLDITKEEDWDFVNEQLKKYLLINLKISDSKGPLEAKYLGSEREGDVMWAYVEIEKVKRLKTITVWNSTLTEIYSDQENIVHFRAFGKVESSKLYRGSEKEVFNWD